MEQEQPSATPVFGGQADAIAKYGMPLFGDGGIPSFASVDNTKTKLTPPQELTVKQLSDIQGQQQIQKQLDQKISFR